MLLQKIKKNFIIIIALYDQKNQRIKVNLFTFYTVSPL